MGAIFNNYNITNMHYSGYDIVRAYACGGSLVWSSTPTGTYRMKIKKIDDTEVYSNCDGAYSGWSEINQTELVNTVGASDIFDALDSISSIDFGGCPSLSAASFGAGAYANNSITSITFTDTSIKHLGTGCFASYKNLESVVIPDSITSMDSGVFVESGLRSVTIGSGLTEISEETFASCTSLRSIDIPNNITSIGEIAFGGCSSLNSVTFNDDSVTTIGARAFGSCTSLRTFDIPSGVTKLENSTFSGCTNLRTIDLKNVSTLGSGVFNGCSSIHTVNLSGVTTLGTYNFSGCTSLSSVTLSDNLIRISEGSFYNCASLSSMTLPNSVKYIDNYVFENCSALTSVNLNNIEEIGQYAFLGCNSLTSLSLDKAVTIGQNAFMATGLTDIAIGEDITNIGTKAFGNYGMQASSMTFTILATIPPIISSSGFVYNSRYINAIYVQDAVVEDYKNDWSQYADKIKPISEKP